MERRKLPLLPVDFFFYPFDTPTRRSFVLSLTLILLGAGFFYYLYHFPLAFALELQEVPRYESIQAPVASMSHAYHTFPLSFTISRAWVAFSATPLQVDRLPVMAMGILQLLGWSLAIAVASLIRSRWAFGIYLLFAFYLFQQDWMGFWVGESGALWVSMFWVLVAFGLAYAFQINRLRLHWTLRWLIFFVWLAIPAGLAYQAGGWGAWLHGFTGSYYFLLLISLLFVIFVAKDPFNLILLAGTNRRHRHTRFHPLLLAGLQLVLLLATLLMVLHYINKRSFPEESLIFHPIPLFLVAAVATVFTSQNLSRSVQFIFSTQRVFTFAMMAWALISVSFLACIYSMGDVIFRDAIERFISLAFLGVGAGWMLYIWVNFLPLLRERIHLYYLTGKGILFGYPVIFIIGLIALVIGEGNDNWKSVKLFTHSQLLMLGDEAALGDEPLLAAEHYQLAAEFVPGSSKAHYNRAAFLLGNPQRYAEALEAYRAATSGYEFAPARLNGALLMQELGRVEAAIRFLRDGAQDPRVANNLGLAYARAGAPDSAIVYFRQALLNNLDQTPSLSNLAHVYFDYDKPRQGKAMMKEALQGPFDEISLFNALYYRLRGSLDSLPEGAKVLHPSFSPNMNQVLYLLQAGDRSQLQPILKTLSADDRAAEPILLDGYFQLLRDSLETGKSRIDYVQAAMPAYAGMGNYLIGLAYFQKNVPEMARKYFNQAGEHDHPRGYFDASRMDSYLGQPDSAFYKFNQLRGRYDTLWQACAQELALLFAAYGQPLYAQTEWDLSTLSAEDRIRQGIYADSLEQYLWSLETFRALLAEDSLNIAPYLEMGRIYLKYRDTLAASTFRLGLVREPEDPALRLGLWIAELLEGKKPTPPDGQQDSPEYQLIAAFAALHTGDSTRAAEAYQEVLKTDPLNTFAILGMADLWMAMGDEAAAHELLLQALKWNDQNPLLWRQYVDILERWGMGEDEDARYAREQLATLPGSYYKGTFRPEAWIWQQLPPR